MNQIIQLISVLITLLLPIGLYILAGYYASNAQWCLRKVIVSLVIGLCIGLYALYSGLESISQSWIGAAFQSGSVIGAIYLIDRVVKGFAKRKGIEWLYTDEPIEDEV